MEFKRFELKYFDHDAFGWYFWDETWANKIGPYESYEEANAALHAYIKELNYESSTNSGSTASRNTMR